MSVKERRDATAVGSRGRRVLAAALLVLLALVSLGAWAFASPVGSSPDDDFHMSSIWCAYGEREGLCEDTGRDDARLVPAQVALAGHCFAFNDEASAACARSDEGAMVPTDRINLGGAYPGLSYAVLGALASTDVTSSVLAMRLVGALIAIALIGGTAIAVGPRLSTPLLAAWLISVVPLGMFMISSVNPSGWALISAGTLWVALVAFLRSRTRAEAIPAAAIAGVSTVIGLGSRPDAVLFTALAVAVAVCLTVERSRAWLIRAILPLAVLVAAGIVAFSGNPSGLAGGDISGGGAALTAADRVYLLFGNVLEVPRLWYEVFAGSLGWLDTPMPAVVGVGGIAVFAGVCFAALRVMTRGKAIALAGTALALWTLPTYVLVQSQAFVGAQVQPRYILPILIVLAGVALWSPERPVQLSRLQLVLAAIVVAGANFTALHFTIRRYVTGVDEPGVDLDAGREWWWSAGPSATTVWIVGGIAFAGLVAALAMLAHRDALRESGISAGLDAYSASVTRPRRR